METYPKSLNWQKSTAELTTKEMIRLLMFSVGTWEKNLLHDFPSIEEIMNRIEHILIKYGLHFYFYN